VAGTYECGNEPSGSKKCGEFLDKLKTRWILRKDSAPWNKEVRLSLEISDTNSRHCR
jgi:hypothetical protein